MQFKCLLFLAMLCSAMALHLPHSEDPSGQDQDEAAGILPDVEPEGSNVDMGCEKHLCQICKPPSGGGTGPGSCCNKTWSCVFDPVFDYNLCLPPYHWICDAPVEATDKVNMNGEYLLSRTPGAPPPRSGTFADSPSFSQYLGVDSFDVYSPPISTLYSQVICLR